MKEHTRENYYFTEYCSDLFKSLQEYLTWLRANNSTETATLLLVKQIKKDFPQLIRMF